MLKVKVAPHTKNSSVRVNLKENSYDVLIGANCLSELGKLIKEKQLGREIFILTDPLVNDLYADDLLKGMAGFDCTTLEIPRGEKQKNLKTLSVLLDQLAAFSAHRDALIIALGGGVVGDLVGFVAATYMRGINYIQVPTTLLAQVDAAIGGKTGVNHPKGKNLIGAFYQPRAVFIDLQTLSSLPARELRTGLAEVVKYGLIKDAAFFEFIEHNYHHLNTKAFENAQTLRAALKVWQTIIAESVKIKAWVVEQDEKESGLRMILNFGHTVGHAVETLTRYKTYNHGEAVAIGMVAAMRMAAILKMLPMSQVERVIDLLQKLNLPVEINHLSCAKILEVLSLDKKVRYGKVNFVLPVAIGKVVVKNDLPLKVVEQALLQMGGK